MRRLTIMAVSAALALGVFAAPAMARSSAADGARPGDQTIAEIAVANGNFTTLVAALSCTGLVPAVSGTTQLTVFAPTDAAFAKLGLNAGNVCSADLSAFGGATNVLLYHVTEGRRTSTSVLAAPRYEMLNGDILTRGELAAAGIAATNISASNGVIHVINSVLLP